MKPLKFFANKILISIKIEIYKLIDSITYLFPKAIFLFLFIGVIELFVFGYKLKALKFLFIIILIFLILNFLNTLLLSKTIKYIYKKIKSLRNKRHHLNCGYYATKYLEKMQYDKNTNLFLVIKIFKSAVSNCLFLNENVDFDFCENVLKSSLAEDYTFLIDQFRTCDTNIDIFLQEFSKAVKREKYTGNILEFLDNYKKEIC